MYRSGSACPNGIYFGPKSLIWGSLHSICLLGAWSPLRIWAILGFSIARIGFPVIKGSIRLQFWRFHRVLCMGREW